MGDLFNMGATFISYDIVENCEESFFSSLGLARKQGHVVYYIDERRYKDDSKIHNKSKFLIHFLLTGQFHRIER